MQKDLAGREKLCIFAKILTTMKRPRQDRWYGDLKRRRPSPENRLLCEQQFGLEELYRMPFAERREFDTQSSAARYFPIERKPRRSVVRMLDELLEWLDAGSPGTVAQFCEKRGLSHNALGELVFCLTEMSSEDFRLMYQMPMADDMSYYALVKNIEINGEAANMLTADIRDAHPETPWKMLSGMRNYIVNDYFQIDNNVIRDVFRNDLPQLGAQIAKYIADTDWKPWGKQ